MVFYRLYIEFYLSVILDALSINETQRRGGGIEGGKERPGVVGPEGAYGGGGGEDK